MESTLAGKRILLVVGGGIAAYKALDLIRRLRERGAAVTPILTAAGAQFVTPLAVGALSATRVYDDLFSRDDEQDVGHIRLAREADLILVAPATADRMAQMAAGLAGDLAGAVLLAARCPILLAPAMNPAMWTHPATRRSATLLERDGIRFVGPEQGEMAEAGESGLGRMSEPLAIAAAVEAMLAAQGGKPLSGRRAVVTSGPTHEPIDPVRYIANRSSGRQGHAMAAALAEAGAQVTLVSGPVSIPDPAGVHVVRVETALQMLAAVEAALPADIGVFVAAVADWRAAEQASDKIKKRVGEAPGPLALAENPDILATIGHGPGRPRLVVGFAAETSSLMGNARAKLERKGADMIVANDVSGDVMGGTQNRVHLLTAAGAEDWPELSKAEVARRLARRFATMLGDME